MVRKVDYNRLLLIKIVVQRLAKNEFKTASSFCFVFSLSVFSVSKKKKMEYRYPLTDCLEDLWPKFRPGTLYVSLKLEHRKDFTISME